MASRTVPKKAHRHLCAAVPSAMLYIHLATISAAILQAIIVVSSMADTPMATVERMPNGRVLNRLRRDEVNDLKESYFGYTTAKAKTKFREMCRIFHGITKIVFIDV